MHHKNEIIFFFQILIIILISSISVNAIGITSRNSIVYEPNLNEDYKLCTRNSENYPFPVYLDIVGPIKEYITLQEQEYTLGPNENKCQYYNVNFKTKPDFYGPSITQIWVKQKSSDSEGSFQVLTNIHHKLSVFVPYPEKYVGITVKTENVNVNEPVQIIISAKNYGEQKINKGNAKIDIYGADDYTNYLISLYTKTASMESMESVEYFSIFDTFGVVPGYYKAEIEFYYDNQITREEDIFRIGTLLVRINDYTKTAISNKINPFEIDIESRWNNKIENLHAKIEFDDLNEDVLTPTIILKPWEKIQLKTFIDLTDQKPGDYKGRIILNYGNVTSYKDIILKVTQDQNEEIPETTTNKDIIENANIESFSMTSILLIIILILIIIDVIYIIYKKKKNAE